MRAKIKGMSNEQQDSSPFEGMAMRGQTAQEGHSRNEAARQDSYDSQTGSEKGFSGDSLGNKSQEGFSCSTDGDGVSGSDADAQSRHVSHRNRVIVLVAAIVIVVLAVLSAFVWPGWALKKSGVIGGGSRPASSAAVTPIVPAKALPDGSSVLVKTVLPDTAGAYARQSVEKTTDWESSQPIEEYKAVYSNGQAGQDITVTVAQWSTSDYALKQYQSLTGQLKGTQIAQGNVSVNGAQTGSYIAREDQKNARNAIVIEQNSSVLFQLSGPKAQMNDFFDKFGY